MLGLLSPSIFFSIIVTFKLESTADEERKRIFFLKPGCKCPVLELFRRTFSLFLKWMQDHFHFTINQPKGKFKHTIIPKRVTLK